MYLYRDEHSDGCVLGDGVYRTVFGYGLEDTVKEFYYEDGFDEHSISLEVNGYDVTPSLPAQFLFGENYNDVI